MYIWVNIMCVDHSFFKTYIVILRSLVILMSLMSLMSLSCVCVCVGISRVVFLRVSS